ncbi:MAG: HAD family hydrolase [Candidatus Delongbacteria bacterium]
MTNKIVFTDFDGTYIKGDSYLMSLFFLGGWKRFIRNSGIFLLSVLEYSFNFITRNEVKRRSYELTYKNLNIDDININIERFVKKLRVFPQVQNKIEELKAEGYKIIAVTASPDIYMTYISHRFGFDACICTETERTGKMLTGKLKRKNCNYSEKVRRIKESDFYTEDSHIIALGNSRGDKQMLEFADEYYFVDTKGNLIKDKMPW